MWSTPDADQVLLDAQRDPFEGVDRQCLRRHPVFENDDLLFELRDRLVGLGSRRSYRAVFTIRGDTVFVLRVRPAAEQRLHPLDLPEEWLD
mgnify:CR=1 FL=1